MPVTLSPLRYPGGKTQIAPFVTQLIQMNDLQGGIYCEPFAGGAGVVWDLLLKGVVEQVAINDLSPAIYAFWYSVLNDTEEFCKMIECTEITIEEWYRQKKVLKVANIGLELAYATLFLNRVNRSGILTAGVIGGKAQSGEYRLDCRFNKVAIIQKIKAIASFKDKIILTNVDANDFLKNIVSGLQGKVFVNIDPPYYNKGKELYQNFFEHKDHVTLFNTIKSLHHPWMVTYDDTPKIVEIYAEYSPRPFALNYSAQVKRKGAELMIYSPKLITQNLSLGVG